MNQTETQKREQELVDVLHTMVPTALETSSLSEVFALADLSYLANLFGSPLAAWEQGHAALGPTSLLETIAANPDAHARLLTSELTLVHEVLAAGEDIVYAGLCGLRSAAFPVTLQGQVIHCVWVRNYLTAPIADSDLEQLGKWCGCKPAVLRERASAVLTEPQAQGLLASARATRDALQAAVEQHLYAGEMVHQLVETERTRSLGTLAGGIAHRFNNLLSVILGYASFVQNRENLSAEADDALHKISDAAQQGRRLTEEILAFAGSDVEEVTTCHVHDTLTSILSLLQSQAPSRIAIETSLVAGQDTVLAPPSAVHQLVFNLLTNALDSLPGGGVIAIASANEAEGADDEAMLCLTITHRGAPAAEATDDELIAGGRLAQARAIAGGLDGTMWVESVPPETTRVELRLPVDTRPEPGSPQTLAPCRVVPATVWVIDDDPIFREMCAQVLADEGHRVTLLESGRELQDLWSQATDRPDALIIDFSMPEFNGLELCAWLKEQGSTSPVILVSGFSEAQPDIHRALQLRKTHFLRKPFSYREMLDIVTVALGETFIGS